MFCGLSRKLAQSFSRGSRRYEEKKEKKKKLKKRRSRSLDSYDLEISAEFSTVTVYEEKIE
ncbi:diacylglycerol kinase delta, partial [Biomphalaria glabrata]